MFYVYVVQSVKTRSTYIGMSKNIDKRISEHNSGKTKSIRHLLPVELIYFEAYRDKTLARKRELELKNSSSKRKRLFERLELTTSKP